MRDADGLDLGGPPAAAGVVHLVGAGPGDPGLLTVRAARLLSTCDVVAHDRLIPREALDLVPDHAERIDVGCRAGDPGMGRAATDRVLIDRARRGHAVVRLKGGDPYVFGRGAEEADACRQAGVAVEVVSGVTSAVAALAAAGIPVTHRGVAAGVAIVTGHEDPTKSGGHLTAEAAAGFPGTLVYLMGLRRLPLIVADLLAHGRSPRTPVGVVQWGATPRQVAVTATLGTIERELARRPVGTPAIVVVGDAVDLAASLPDRASRPLHGVAVDVPRVDRSPASVVGALRQAGADVLDRRLVRTTAIAVDAGDRRRVLEAGRIELTSVAAVDGLRRLLEAEGADARALAGAELVAVDHRVADALARALAVRADVIGAPDGAHAGALALGAADDPGVDVATHHDVDVVDPQPVRRGAVTVLTDVAAARRWLDRRRRTDAHRVVAIGAPVLGALRPGGVEPGVVLTGADLDDDTVGTAVVDAVGRLVTGGRRVSVEVGA